MNRRPPLSESDRMALVEAREHAKLERPRQRPADVQVEVSRVTEVRKVGLSGPTVVRIKAKDGRMVELRIGARQMERLRRLLGE